jgi:hypothetical protein
MPGADIIEFTPGSFTAAVSRLTISVAGLQADTEKMI